MTSRLVRWSDEALDEYDGAVAYLRQRDARAAGRYVEALGAAIAGLARRNTGRFGRVPGTLEKSLPKWRYVIVYQLLSDEHGGETLYIVHIIHTSGDWPKTQAQLVTPLRPTHAVTRRARAVTNTPIPKHAHDRRPQPHILDMPELVHAQLPRAVPEQGRRRAAHAVGAHRHRAALILCVDADGKADAVFVEERAERRD